MNVDSFLIFVFIILIALGNGFADSDNGNSGSSNSEGSSGNGLENDDAEDKDSDDDSTEKDSEEREDKRNDKDDAEEKDEEADSEEDKNGKADDEVEEIEEEEEREIEVEIRKGVAKVKIEINGVEQEFEIEAVDKESIIDGIVRRTGLTSDEVLNIMEIDIEEEERENEIEIEIKNGLAKVKTEINGVKEEFTIEGTNREEVLTLVAERLGLSIDELSTTADIEIEEKTEVVNEDGEITEIEIEVENEKGEFKWELKAKNSIVETKLKVEQEIGVGVSKLKVKLSNGNNQEIKVMPDRVSEIAIQKLESKNIKIELKEVGQGSEVRAVFEAEAENIGKLFGLIETRLKESAQIDPVTGNVLEIARPWWTFLVFGKEPALQNEVLM